MEVTPLDAPLGADVSDVDLRRELTTSQMEVLEAALLKYKLLRIHGPVLSAGEQVRFSAGFGELEVFPEHSAFPDGPPEIFPVSNDASRGFTEVGRYWHADGSFRPRPTVLSFFHMIETTNGTGDTSYADTAAVLTRLPPDMRELAPFLKTVHGNGTVHDLLRRHPETGEDAVFVNLGMTVGLIRPGAGPMGIEPSRSRDILSELGDIMDGPNVSFRHRWRAGDLIIADNRCVAHRAHIADPATLRLLHRTTTLGRDLVKTV